jgi:hypothetical protein
MVLKVEDLMVEWFGIVRQSEPPCPARTPHGNVLSLAHHLEPESVERSDYSGLWGIDRELGHQAGMVASATKASRSGESSGRTSAPNVSM